MEEGRYLDAYKALKQVRTAPVPPPHALWKLGIWLAKEGNFRRARLPLQRFVELYKKHQDRAAVLLDLAREMKELGKIDQARQYKEEADALAKR